MSDQVFKEKAYVVPHFRGYNQEFEKFNSCSVSIKSEWVNEAKAWLLKNLSNSELDRLDIKEPIQNKWEKDVKKWDSIIQV